MGMCIKIFCLTSLFLFSQELIAQPQDFFPLQVGNTWQYKTYFQGEFRGYYDIRILADSIMPNGKKYFKTIDRSRWIRIDDSLNTYQYDYFNVDQDPSTTELLIDRFNNNPGTTWVSYQGGDKLIANMESTYNTVVFGNVVDVKVISYYSGDLWLERVHYSREHGLIYFAVEGGASYILVGAKISGVQYGTIVSVEGQPMFPPTNFLLGQNYPNPFNPITTITFSLPQTSLIILKVWDILGREIATLAHGSYSAGLHNIEFKVNNLPSGVYLYRFTANNYTMTKKMLLVR